MLIAVIILAAVAGLVLLNRWDRVDDELKEYRLMEYTDARWRKLNATRSQAIVTSEKYDDARLKRLSVADTQNVETSKICSDACCYKLNACC